MLASLELYKESGDGSLFALFRQLKKQDAAMTHEDMYLLVNLLLKRRVSKRGLWMFDHTDGCAKQYWCDTALYLLALLSVNYSMLVYHAVGAPSHGKCEVDGGNAVEKRYVVTKRYLIEAPNGDASTRRMSAHAMAGNAQTSFAVECACICSSRE
jgi:hypothetical protein